MGLCRMASTTEVRDDQRSEHAKSGTADAIQGALG